MLFYEELEGFNMLYEKERNSEIKETIISESFSYSLIINNPLLSVYLRNKYPNELFHNKHKVIETIINYLNEFTELNGSSRYRYQYKFVIIIDG